MKQVLLRRGQVTVEDVPRPTIAEGFVLVRTAASLVSAGTERSSAEAGRSGLVERAVRRPDAVRRVLTQVAENGLLETIDAVRGRLDEPAPLGYSAAGFVVDAGGGAFKPGDLVACAGAGFSHHAEMIAVPHRLCVPVPGGVSAEDAAFATIGAIALHGVRLANVQVGATVAVIGLGIVGQLCAQIASAAGCRVLAIDRDANRVSMARRLGADSAAPPDEAASAAGALTSGSGVDAVLIAAHTTGNEPIELAGALARDRAPVVVVGAVGMEVPRAVFYRKELPLIVSRSYGPGRYDAGYEIDGHDYPIGYVRWTEERNIAAFLDLIGRGRVKVAPLVTHRFPVTEALSAYDVIAGKSNEPFVGVVLTYAGHETDLPLVVTGDAAPSRSKGRLGAIGAGSFAKSILLPAFKAAGADFVGIASRQGVTAKAAAERFGFRFCTTDERMVLTDDATDAVVIATRHRTHAAQAIAAAHAGKDVFVETPLCVDHEQLAEIERTFSRPGAPRLMVGFNRRFAPLAVRLKAFFDDAGRPPIVAQYRVNAGALASDHWLNDPAEGGRFVGEGCHFIDLLCWLAASRPVSIVGRSQNDRGIDESIVVVLNFENGSLATLSYVVGGDRALEKERLEVHGGGRSAVLDDFRQLHLYHGGKEKTEGGRLRQDKGHKEECRAFLRALAEGAPSPIPLDEVITSTRVTLLARDSAYSQKPIEKPWPTS